MERVESKANKSTNSAKLKLAQTLNSTAFSFKNIELVI